MSVGGSIQSVSIDGRLFKVAADADSQRKLGGDENEVAANGDGSARLLKTAVTWRVTGLTLSIDDFLGDAEFLQERKDSNEQFAIAVTYASGAVYQGTGQIVGETNISSANATASVDLAGGGILTRQ